MANAFRHLRGNTQGLPQPTTAADAIEIGDLMFLDSATNTARPASQAAGVNYAAKVTAFAAAFLGVAAEAKPAGASGSILVWTAGDFLFDAPSGAGTDYDVLSALAIGDGAAVQDQGVSLTATPADAIARVVRQKAAAEATVECRLLGRASSLGFGPDRYETALASIAALAAGADLAASAVFAHPQAVTLVSVGYLAAGTDFGAIDDANTSVFALTDAAGNAIVTKTYNTATQPAGNALNDLGALSGANKVLTAGEVVKLAITNGATAKTPAGHLVLRFLAPNA